MKKSFFFATMLLSIAATAQQRTFVKSVGTNYAAKQVTFNISWAAGSRGTVSANTYNSKVWVLVDYQEVQNGATVGSWKRADILLSSLPVNCTADGTNTKGFWYQGQATAVQNANITVTLSGVPAQFNWCAFVSDCPPKVAASNNGSYTFAGTPPFVLTAANGAIQQVNGNILAHSSLTITPAIVTDQTNCPGVFCPYTGTDLFIDATHICQQRTSGAQNWEAYIKDARDGNIYQIVQAKNSLWWFANDLIYAGNRVAVCSGKSVYWSGAAVCPAGWRLPTSTQATQKWGATNPSVDTEGAPVDFCMGCSFYLNACQPSDAVHFRADIATSDGYPSTWHWVYSAQSNPTTSSNDWHFSTPTAGRGRCIR